MIGFKRTPMLFGVGFSELQTASTKRERWEGFFRGYAVNEKRIQSGFEGEIMYFG